MTNYEDEYWWDESDDIPNQLESNGFVSYGDCIIEWYDTYEWIKSLPEVK